MPSVNAELQGVMDKLFDTMKHIPDKSLARTQGGYSTPDNWMMA